MDAEELAGTLRALGTPSRLALLSSLRFPRAVSDILVRPSQTREGENPSRPMSKQAVRRHLDKLESLGLVRQIEGGGIQHYVVDRPRLFAVTEAFSSLTQLYGGDTQAGDGTEPLDDPPPGRGGPARRGPDLLLVHGAYRGRSFPLVSETLDGEVWTIGRRRDAAVPLDYDPFVSRDHAIIRRERRQLVLEDNPANRNGTSVNFGPLPRDRPYRLVAGDVIGVGRSLLVYTP